MATTWAILLGAGLIAGISGTVTGIGSVFSYPVLLALGLPATAANVTNTVALALGGVGGAYGSRPELTGHAALVRRLCLACLAGSLLGSVLLLASPPGFVERVVPFLVAGAAVTILLPRPHPATANTRDWPTPPARTMWGLLVVSIYNGYFAAAGGVLIIAVLLATTTQSLARINSFKNVLVLLSDAVAAGLFAAFGPVAWTHVTPLAIGLLAGSWLGPAIARRLPTAKLRVAIGIAALALAAKLGIDAL